MPHWWELTARPGVTYRDYDESFPCCDRCYAGVLDEGVRGRLHDSPGWWQGASGHDWGIILCPDCALRAAWCEYAGIDFWEE